MSGKNYDHSSLMTQTQKMESQVICLNPMKKKTVSEVIGFLPYSTLCCLLRLHEIAQGSYLIEFAENILGHRSTC